MRLEWCAMDTSEATIKLLSASLEHFKDWTNYLLITTVAALGWVASGDTRLDRKTYNLTVIFFCASIVFAIFTLALIPMVGESIGAGWKSIYDVKVIARPLYLLEREYTFMLKYFCWPQHVLFLAGVIAFSWGSIRGEPSGSPGRASNPPRIE